MDWTTRLNLAPPEIHIGSGCAEILHWDYCPNIWDNQPHRHTFFEVCLVGERGCGVFTHQGVPYALSEGDLFIARPGILHQIVNAGETRMELSWISFQWSAGHRGEAAQSTAGHRGETAQSSGAGGEDRRSEFSEVDRLMLEFVESDLAFIGPPARTHVAALWQTLRSTAADGPALLDMQLAHLTAAFIIAIASAVVAAGGAAPNAPAFGEAAGRASLRRAIRYIHDNLDRPLAVPDVAAYIFASPRQLSRLFHEFVGTSPAQYITRARLDRAAALLRTGDQTIKEVGIQVGYVDVHHFTRVFSRCFGCPPAAHRRGRPLKPVPNIQNPGRLL